MPHRTAMIYHYDGTFEGLLCSVFESYVHKELPLDILPPERAQASLYPVRRVETDADHAARVFSSLRKKLGAAGENFVTTGFFAAEENKALLLYRFIELGYQVGPQITSMLGHPIVNPVYKMNRAVHNEAHLMLGLLRFSQYQGALAAVIAPKHFILPLIAPHFCDRYPEEQFLIFDQNHQAALIYRPYESRMLDMDGLELPEAEDEELLCRRLWQGYYDAITIKARENPRCRMTHMPKRFWPQITEMKERKPELHPVEEKDCPVLYKPDSYVKKLPEPQKAQP